MRSTLRASLGGLALTFLTAGRCAALTAHLITAPSLVNHVPAADMRVGTADDTVSSSALPPNDSSPNVHGAASFATLAPPGSAPGDYAYILFVDGTIEFTPNYAGSTASNLVLTITGGSLRSTDEFNYPTRGEATTTLAGGTAQMNPMTGAATVQLTGTFTVNTGMVMLSLPNQTLTAAPGKAEIVVSALFGHSGDQYVDQVLVPLVPTNATAIVLVEFSGNVSSPDAPSLSGWSAPGVLAAYTTDALGCADAFPTLCGGGVTTTTSTIPPSCTVIAVCRTGLTEALPNPANAADKKTRHVDRKLAALSTKAGKLLDHAATSSGKKRTKQYAKARKVLQMLLAAARAADGKGMLGAPLVPLEMAVQALLAQIPTS